MIEDIKRQEIIKSYRKKSFFPVLLALIFFLQILGLGCPRTFSTDIFCCWFFLPEFHCWFVVHHLVYSGGISIFLVVCFFFDLSVFLVVKLCLCKVGNSASGDSDSIFLNCWNQFKHWC